MKSMTGRIENYDGFAVLRGTFVILSMTSLSYHIRTANGGVNEAL